MKRIIYIFVLFVFQLGIAQETNAPITPVGVEIKDRNSLYNFVEVEVKPEYPGGLFSFMKLVRDNFKMPDDKSFTGGKMVVEFVVENDGSVTNIRILKDIGFGTAEEAARVVRLSEKWRPAEHNGYKVRCSYIFPINLSVN